MKTVVRLQYQLDIFFKKKPSQSFILVFVDKHYFWYTLLALKAKRKGSQIVLIGDKLVYECSYTPSYEL